MTVSLLASAADFGTRSISTRYQQLLNPASFHGFPLGFRKMGPKGWLQGRRYLNTIDSGTVVCLFNAPILLAAMFRKRQGVRYVGVLDWTESYPSLQRGKFMSLYDQLYIRAFNRLDAVFSPAEGFRDYYNTRGARILPCVYPLPYDRLPSETEGNPEKTRVLFVGANYKRKGGDLLLSEWEKRNPRSATLTFVSPNPPPVTLPGVTFLRDVQAGSPKQQEIFASHDVFILPTRQEPFGFAILEAMNVGMCPVTTEAAGAADVVRRSGGIAAPSPAEAVERLFQLLEDRAEIDSRRASCRQFIRAYESEVSDSLDELVHGRKTRV